MRPEEKTLLLTIARILRAKIRDETYAEQADDFAALNDALSPFDGTGVERRAEYNGGDTPPI